MHHLVDWLFPGIHLHITLFVSLFVADTPVVVLVDLDFAFYRSLMLFIFPFHWVHNRVCQGQSLKMSLICTQYFNLFALCVKKLLWDSRLIFLLLLILIFFLSFSVFPSFYIHLPFFPSLIFFLPVAFYQSVFLSSILPLSSLFFVLSIILWF